MYEIFTQQYINGQMLFSHHLCSYKILDWGCLPVVELLSKTYKAVSSTPKHSKGGGIVPDNAEHYLEQ